MKTLFSLLAICLCFGLYAQKHESPYVFDGRSFSFDMPKGYTNTDATDPSFQFYDRSSANNNQNEFENYFIFGLFHKNNIPDFGDENPGENFLEAFVSSMVEDHDEFTVENHALNSGKEFTIAKTKSTMGEIFEEPRDFYAAVTDFGEVLIICMWFDLEMTGSAKEFYATVDSYKEYETDRENAFFYDVEAYEEGPFFENSLYETELYYEDIFFGDEEDREAIEQSFSWEEEFGDEFPELMIAYAFIDYESESWMGGVKVFSGGTASNYTADAQKLAALQNVFDDHEITRIQSTGRTIKGNSLSFSEFDYQCTANEYRAVKFYTSEYKGEMLFILVYGTELMSATFTDEYENFVKTMWFLEY